MKRTRKKETVLVLFAFFASFLLLFSSLTAVYANSITNKTLPGFLEKLLIRRNPNANATELSQIRFRWIEQLARNQERIASTNGVVLKGPESALDSDPSYLASVDVAFTYGEEYPTHWGQLYNSGNVAGPSDGSYAEFITTYYYDESFVAGYMSDRYSHGDFYIDGKIGSQGATWDNYVILFAANDINTPYGYWDLIGYTQITYPYNWQYEAYHWVGYAGTYYSVLSISVWTPYPPPYYLLQNDALLDDVLATNTY